MHGTRHGGAEVKIVSMAEMEWLCPEAPRSSSEHPSPARGALGTPYEMIYCGPALAHGQEWACPGPRWSSSASAESLSPSSRRVALDESPKNDSP